MAANRNPNDNIAIACGLNPRYPGIFQKINNKLIVINYF